MEERKMDLTKLGLAEKEQKILEAAIDVFSQRGFSGATTNEIAKKAGVAEGTIFRYFKTKKDILRGILIQMLNMASEPIILEGISKILLNTENKDLREVLKAFVKDRLELMESLFPMIKIIITEALYHEDIREAFFDNIISKAFEIFKIFYQRMVERGLIRENVSVLTMGRSLIANIVFFVIYKQFFADKFNQQDMDKELDAVIDIIMNGISKNPTSDQS
jgi:AcrR family transcriptional regulator